MPKLSPRKIARANGEKHYEGGVCGRCGNTKRYVVSAACIKCTYLSKEERAKEPIKGERRPQINVKQEEINFAEVVRRVYERKSSW